jgi:hypothetical protein
MLWQMPEKVRKLCAKIDNWCTKISVCFPCLPLSPFT